MHIAGPRPVVVLRMVLFLVSAVAVGALAAVRPLYAAALASLVVVLIFRAQGSQPFLGPLHRTYRWIPWAWLVLFASSNTKFSPPRSPLEAASGSLTADNIAELLAYAVIGALAALALYSMRRSRRPLNVSLLGAWPAVAVLSAAWSIIPLFSLTRGLQLCVPILLAGLSIRVWREEPEAGEIMWRKALRLFVQFITVMTVMGFAVHKWEDGRFMWPGAQHAILASGMLGFGFLALLAGGRSLLGFSKISFALRLGLFGVALVMGQTRSVLLGIILAALIGLWLVGRNQPLARYLTIPIFLGALAFTAVLAKGPLLAYLSRGEPGSYVITTLNGRIPVWGLAIHAVSSGSRWITGFGFGSARVILFQQVEWAGEAHNTWVEILLGTGMLGLVLAVAGVITLAVHLFRERESLSRPMRAAAVLFIYLLVLSEVDYYLAAPGFAFTAFAFFYVVAMGRRGEGTRRPMAGTVALPGPALQSRFSYVRGPSVA